MRDDDFEWDDGKAESNRRKHAISFEQAREAFADPDAIAEPDDDPDEDRWRLIGRTAAGLLLVVYTERATRYRIITARRANQHEQNLYNR